MSYVVIGIVLAQLNGPRRQTNTSHAPSMSHKTAARAMACIVVVSVCFVLCLARTAKDWVITVDINGLR